MQHSFHHAISDWHRGTSRLLPDQHVSLYDKALRGEGIVSLETRLGRELLARTFCGLALSQARTLFSLVIRPRYQTREKKLIRTDTPVLRFVYVRQKQKNTFIHTRNREAEQRRGVWQETKQENMCFIQHRQFKYSKRKKEWTTTKTICTKTGH